MILQNHFASPQYADNSSQSQALQNTNGWQTGNLQINAAYLSS